WPLPGFVWAKSTTSQMSLSRESLVPLRIFAGSIGGIGVRPCQTNGAVARIASAGRQEVCIPRRGCQAGKRAGASPPGRDLVEQRRLPAGGEGLEILRLAPLLDDL